MPTTTIVSNADIDFYFTSVQMAYLKALAGNNSAIYPKIAYVPPAGARTVERVPMVDSGGQQFNGTRIKFPISLAASAPQVWEFGRPRPVEPFSSIEVAVDMQRWAVPSKREFYEVFNSDLFNIIKAQLPQMMDRSLVLWDWVLARTLVANAVWTPDSKPFFTPQTAKHEANPMKPGVATYYNDVPITGIDEPNIRTLLSLIENAPGPDGLPLDTDEVKLIFLAPNKDHELQLKNVLNAEIAAVEVNANAGASRTNQLVGAAEVVLFKQLARTKDAPTFGGNLQDRGKVGYVLAVPRGMDRPLAVVPARQPTPYYTGLNGNDHLRATQGVIEFGWDAFGQCKLMLPARALRYCINPV